jgi:hypothetical protein
MDDYNAVDFDLEGHNSSNFKLVQEFEAHGNTRQKAIENARMVEYNVVVRDSIFTFDSNLKFKEDAIFRAQRLKMTLFIPYNFPFTMDEGTSRFISQYVDYEFMDGYTWQMTEDGLKCMTCPVNDKEKITDLRDFNDIEITGKFDVRIIPGGDYSVELTGSDRAKEKYSIERKGETLIIDYQGKKDFDWKMKDFDIEGVEITITLPNLENLEASGVGSIRLDEFTGDEVEIELRGPVKLKGGVNAHNLTINLTGSAEADISGNANNLNARVEFASKLRAYHLQVHDAFVETSGASSAKVNVTGTLEIEEGIASEIDYRGNPQVTKRH